jgi:hypothetical protein
MTAYDWLDAHGGEVAARHGRAADATKGIAALMAAAAGVLVALALASDGSASVTGPLLGVTVTLGLLVVVLDRRVSVDVVGVLERSRLYEWDDARLLAELRVLQTAALDVNESVVKGAVWVLGAEAVAAVAAGVAALVSLG